MNKIIDSVSSSSGAAATIYSDVVLARDATTICFQFDCTETAATYAGVISLWATMDEDALDATDDTGWVEMTTTHGWDGFPSLTSGAIADGDADLEQAGNAGAFAYRLKIVRSGGTATINAWGAAKDNN